MASFKKSGKGWQVQIAIKGVRESRTFSTKAEAISWAGLRETEIRHEASTGIGKKLPSNNYSASRRSSSPS